MYGHKTLESIVITAERMAYQLDDLTYPSCLMLLQT